MFKLDTKTIELRAHNAATAAKMKDVSPGEPATIAVLAELARQFHAAGAPDLPPDQLFATLLSDHLALRSMRNVVPSADALRARIRDILTARVTGETNASIDRIRAEVGPLLTAQAALQRAGEEMPTVDAVMQAHEDAYHTDDVAPRASRGALVAQASIDLFRPVIARLTQRAEKAERDLDQAHEVLTSEQRMGIQVRKERDVLRVHIAELEAATRSAALILGNNGAKTANRCDDAQAVLGKVLREDGSQDEVRDEPSLSLVEQMTRIYLAELNRPVTSDMVELPSPRTAIAAILRALAAMSTRQIVPHLDHAQKKALLWRAMGDVNGEAEAHNSAYGWAGLALNYALDQVRVDVACVLAAKDAACGTLTELKAQANRGA
jgi:hypothetical protein